MSGQVYILILLFLCACFVPNPVQRIAASQQAVLTPTGMQELGCKISSYDPGEPTRHAQRSAYFSKQEGDNWFSRGSAFWGYGFWMFQVLSHFLTLLVVNALFGPFFAKPMGQSGGSAVRTFSLGLIFLFGLPLIAIYSLFTLLGLPFGLLLLLVYVLSLWLGDCLAALLLCHFLNSRNERPWNFWTIVLLSLGVVVVLDLLLFFPVLGVLCYLAVLAYTFGTLTNMVLASSKLPEIRAGVLI